MVIGLLGIGQPIFCGPFEDRWEDPVFVRELNGHKSFAQNMHEQTRKVYGYAPLIGSLPEIQEGFLQTNREWFAREYSKFKRSAVAGNATHKRALAELEAVMCRLRILSLRHTGVGRLVGDHPAVFAALTAGALLYCYSLVQKHYRTKKPKTKGFISRLFNS